MCPRGRHVPEQQEAEQEHAAALDQVRPLGEVALHLRAALVPRPRGGDCKTSKGRRPTGEGGGLGAASSLVHVALVNLF